MAQDFTPPAAFIQMLVEECGFDKRRVVQTEKFDVHFVDLTPLKLKLSPDSTPFVVAKKLSAIPHVSPLQLQEVVQDIIKDGISTGAPLLFVVGGTVQAPRGPIQRLMATNKIALLPRNRFDSAYQSRDKAAVIGALTSSLVAAIGRQTLSPYHSKIPATAGSFFGRAPLLRRVLSVQDNFTFVGNRRIGKTSVLQEIKHRLTMAKEQVIIADLYGTLYNNTNEVLAKILTELDPSGNAERQSTHHDIRNVFRSVVARLAIHNLVVVMIDELDKILEFDRRNSNELMELFRGAFYKTENTRFYGAGFRQTRASMKDGTTPLYGFTTAVILSRLSLQETKDMIEVPLHNLGIDVTTKPITEAIYTETGGHPELIQMCCSEIIKQFEERESVPDPTDILTEVFYSEDFREKVFGAYLANTHAPEQITAYLLMKLGLKDGGTFDSFEFNMVDIDSCLKSVGKETTMVDLYTIAENLTISGVIVQQRGGSRYRFAVPQLARYCQNYQLDFMIQKALEEVDKNLKSWSDIIRSEPEG